MKATFDFIPDYCPNCGKEIFTFAHDSNQAKCDITTGQVEAFQTEQGVSCPECGQCILIFEENTVPQGNVIMRDVIEEAAYNLARIEPNPAKWQAAVVYLLKLLECQASAGGEVPKATFDSTLQLLAADIEGMTTKITMPLGWLAGKAITLAEAIQGLSAEVSGHAADLEHAADANPRNDQADVFWYKKQAETLRRYGAAAWLIHWQTLTPAQKAQSKIDPAGMLELVEKYNLKLPPDLAGLVGEAVTP